MERSAIRDQPHRPIPHCASLHAGYLRAYPATRRIGSTNVRCCGADGRWGPYRAVKVRARTARRAQRRRLGCGFLLRVRLGLGLLRLFDYALAGRDLCCGSSRLRRRCGRGRGRHDFHLVRNVRGRAGARPGEIVGAAGGRRRNGIAAAEHARGHRIGRRPSGSGSADGAQKVAGLGRAGIEGNDRADGRARRPPPRALGACSSVPGNATGTGRFDITRRRSCST